MKLHIEYEDGKTKDVDGSSVGFEINSAGIKYADSDGLVRFDLFHKIKKFDLEMEPTEGQKKYAAAFREAYSDSRKEPGSNMTRSFT